MPIRLIRETRRRPVPPSAHHRCNAGLLGRARLHAGDAAGAVRPLQQSLRSLTKDGEGFNNLGVALMQLQRLDEAAQAFARAVVLQPRDPQSWRNLAGAYTNLKRGQSFVKYLIFRFES